MALATLLLLTAAQLASAHFQVLYPQWRAATLGSGIGNYSQWIYPCAGVPPNAPGSNRTDWPLTGGSLKLDLHHPWTYVFVNLGLGDNTTNFNYTLTPDLTNSTGNGTLCIPKLALPAGLNVADGTKASIQVVTSGDSGSALYNDAASTRMGKIKIDGGAVCADITFRSSATVLNSSECANSPGVSSSVVSQCASGSGSGSSNSSLGSSNTTGGSSGKSAGSTAGVNVVAMTSVFVLAVAFVFGIGA